MYFSSQIIQTLPLKCVAGENLYLHRWWMRCHWQSLLHRRLKWKWSWADPAWQCPLPLLSVRKTTVLKSSFSGLRTVSPLAAAVGSIWQNLSDVVNAFKSTVIDFKGSLSKCLSLRFQAIWDSLKHWICSHDYSPWQIWRTSCFVGIRICSFLLFRLFTVVSWGKPYTFASQ